VTAFLPYCCAIIRSRIHRQRLAPGTLVCEAMSKIGFTAFRLSHLSQNPEGAWVSLIHRSDYGFHALDYSAIKSVNL
jgi:hypothetical protein